jgi:hypothetical protein
MRNVQERKTLTAAALSDMRLIVPPRSWQPASSDVVATHNNERSLTNRGKARAVLEATSVYSCLHQKSGR